MYGYKPKRVDAVEIITEASGRKVESDIKKCCHCGSYWKVQPGSGIQRGYCGRCGDFFCSPSCMNCYPYEQQLLDKAKMIEAINRGMKDVLY